MTRSRSPLGSGPAVLAPDGGTGARPTVGAVLVGSAATFGLVISSALAAVIAAGLLQWKNFPPWLDNGIPLAILAGGLILSGRVATDVAGRYGPLCGLGAAAMVCLIGLAVSRAGEAHGEGIELWQIGIAGVVVLMLSSGGAWWVGHRRTRAS